MSDRSTLESAMIDIIAGSAGGTVQCLSFHPLDTVKVRLQTQSLDRAHYRGMSHAFSTIVREEGVTGLYKGIQSPLFGLTFFTAFQFFSYGLGKVAAMRLCGSDKKEANMTECCIAGLLAGTAEAILVTPIDLLKTQLQRPGHKYSGFRDCAQYVRKINGISGYYQGLGATILRDAPGSAVYWCTYEIVKKKTKREGSDDLDSRSVLLAGGAAGLSYWTLIYPLDVIKSTVQNDAIIRGERKFRGISDCTRQVYRKIGLGGFYRGITPCVVRSVPANAVAFWVYEMATATAAAHPSRLMNANSESQVYH
ncbi:mitochondrial substrate carrier family protein [Planoprotostelium fungivorum]|uniref:Mitochondrial substrate carrier family protein n=1 Tax=Planoprotostelium fungivorum TaxID=1890364 RepID=A0A2P6NK98_9EUKA|nr:mitochondrial substrate carrier family protein [Planoprotostelium fungivorum]